MSVGILVVELRRHAAVRKMEWAMAGVLTSLGMLLALPGSTWSTSNSFMYVAQRWGNEERYGWLLLVVGVARLTTLFLNGTKLRRSAEVRLSFSLLGFMFMFLWASDIYLAAAGAFSSGVIAYGWFAVMELMNISQAASDQQTRNTERQLLQGASSGPDQGTGATRSDK